MAALTIGQLAREVGVHVETVRYYQRRGLLAEPKRPARSVRRYGDDAVLRLTFIRRAQDVGFTLAEIKELVKLTERPSCRGARTLAVLKLESVETRLRNLEGVRQALGVLIDRSDAEHGISAMMRTTGYSLSITGQMQADGRITLKGVHTPDEAVPFKPYVEELARRGVRIEEL